MHTEKLTPALVADFFAEQLGSLPGAGERYRALSDVECRDIRVEGRGFRAQFNPSRAVSTAARVDAASLASRPCFLCRNNRPESQRSIDLGDYELLVNPFPIFPRHFTIPSKTHVPQSMEGRIGDMCRLAYAMEGYTVFFNGASCGASAPDHQHFQAGNSDFLPDRSFRQEVVRGDGYRIFADGDGPVRALCVEAESPETMAVGYRRVSVAAGCGDAMFNLLCEAEDGGKLALTVIPRKAHRPDFYGTGDGQVLVSPASVDLAGVFIFPRRADFERADSAMIESVCRQVCLDDREFTQLISRL